MRKTREHTWPLAVVAVFAAFIISGPRAVAEDASAPAILQMFEARWDTIEDRMADIFEVGYGQMWLPPPSAPAAACRWGTTCSTASISASRATKRCTAPRRASSRWSAPRTRRA